ncbi:PID1 [Cervus elaphus hippelaphus]|uniref:PTB-containing, cubilin and LRP1-interacting protein n=1 Tax=Cervus elaphus hippelaphus TaxID=46360 RepID=A0A212D3H1_CEREH|nr:PID1 [Cervus elaphus hippelaphus]
MASCCLWVTSPAFAGRLMLAQTHVFGGLFLDSVSLHPRLVNAGWDPGYQAASIKLVADPCASNPCHHGNCSLSGSDGYVCICNEGYEGPNCEQALSSVPASGWTESTAPRQLQPVPATQEPEILLPRSQATITMPTWQPKTGQKVVEMKWDQVEVVPDIACGNASANSSAGGRLVSFEVPQNTSVKIRQDATASLILLWKVTATGFQQCSLIDGRSVTLLQAPGGLVLLEEMLALGQNHFIVLLMIVMMGMMVMLVLMMEVIIMVVMMMMVVVVVMIVLMVVTMVVMVMAIVVVVMEVMMMMVVMMVVVMVIVVVVMEVMMMMMVVMMMVVVVVVLVVVMIVMVVVVMEVMIRMMVIIVVVMVVIVVVVMEVMIVMMVVTMVVMVMAIVGVVMEVMVMMMVVVMMMMVVVVVLVVVMIVMMVVTMVVMVIVIVVVVMEATFSCNCDDPYTGTFCEEFDACQKKPCQNNASCLDAKQKQDGGNFTCVCLADPSPLPLPLVYVTETTSHILSVFALVHATHWSQSNHAERLLRPCPAPLIPSGHSARTMLKSEKELGQFGPGGLQHFGQWGEWEDEGAEARAWRDAHVWRVSEEEEGKVEGIAKEQKEKGRKAAPFPSSEGSPLELSQGYHGLYCEEEYEECLSGPCLNAATCRDLVNGYECVCLAEYKGIHCESYKDPCANHFQTMLKSKLNVLTLKKEPLPAVIFHEPEAIELCTTTPLMKTRTQSGCKALPTYHLDLLSRVSKTAESRFTRLAGKVLEHPCLMPYVTYLGKVPTTGMQFLSGCTEKPVIELWKKHTLAREDVFPANALLEIRPFQVWLHHLDHKGEATVHMDTFQVARIAYCTADHNVSPNIFAWVYREINDDLSYQMDCHAVECESKLEAKKLAHAMMEAFRKTFHSMKSDGRIHRNSSSEELIVTVARVLTGEAKPCARSPGALRGRRWRAQADIEGVNGKQNGGARLRPPRAAVVSARAPRCPRASVSALWEPGPSTADFPSLARTFRLASLDAPPDNGWQLPALRTKLTRIHLGSLLRVARELGPGARGSPGHRGLGTYRKSGCGAARSFAVPVH